MPPPVLDAHLFRVLLEQMNCDEMAQHSTLNHHVDGMHYLCLARTPALTVKLYLMEEPRNDHSGYLVHPHTHRYSFSSIVLAGALHHVRFRPTKGLMVVGQPVWDRSEYHAEAGSLRKIGRAILMPEAELCAPGAAYFNTESDIHTLLVQAGQPLLLGLMQFADTRSTSDLYLPVGHGPLLKRDVCRPAPEDLMNLRFRALDLLAASATKGAQP